MLVRIRLPRGADTGRNKRRIAPLTFIVAGLLRMTAVLCLMLALWRLTTDLGWTGAFFIDDGFFSHWQVWLGITFVVSMLSFRLQRLSRPPEPAVPPAAPPVASQTEPVASPERESEKREFVRRGAR
jgi:hypothetical protein